MRHGHNSSHDCPLAHSDPPTSAPQTNVGIRASHHHDWQALTGVVGILRDALLSASGSLLPLHSPTFTRRGDQKEPWWGLALVSPPDAAIFVAGIQ